MLKLLATLALFALCAAQVERPVFPVTFTTTTETEVTYLDKNGEERLSGSGKMSRYQEQNKGVHIESIRSGRSPEPVEDFHFSLYRFDMGLEFRYDRSTDTPIVRCHAEQVYGDMYPYFDWITNALYGGVKSIDGLNYEFWMIEVGADKHEVGVDPLNRNVPVYYMHHHEYDNRTIYHKFIDFKAEIPPETDFDIPPFCQTQLATMEKLKQIKQRA